MQPHTTNIAIGKSIDETQAAKIMQPLTTNVAFVVNVDQDQAVQFIRPDHWSIPFSLLNPFPHKPWFLCVCSRGLLKTL